MEIAKILVNETTGRRLFRKRIPAGIVGATVSVEFDHPVWDRLEKTVIFRGNEVRMAEFDGKIATVPHEVVVSPGPRLFFGIWGYDPESGLRLPLIEVEIGPIEEATDPEADLGTDPTLPIWAQLQQDVEQLKQGSGISVTGATPGQVLAVKSIDENGKPTEWENMDMPDTGGFVVNVKRSATGTTTDKTSKEIYEAYKQGKVVSCHCVDVVDDFVFDMPFAGGGDVLCYFACAVVDKNYFVVIQDTTVTLRVTELATADDVPTDEDIDSRIDAKLNSGGNANYLKLPTNEDGTPNHGTVGYYAVSDGNGGITWVEAGNSGGSSGGGSSGGDENSGGDDTGGDAVPTTEQLTTMKWRGSGWPTFTDNGDGTYAMDGIGTIYDDPGDTSNPYYTMFYPGEIAGGIVSIKYNKPVVSGGLNIVVWAVDKKCQNCSNVTKGGAWSGDPNTYAMTTCDDTFTIQMPEGTYPFVWFRKGTIIMEGDEYETTSNYATALHFQNGDIQIFVTGATAAAETSAAELVDNDYAMDYGVATASLVTDSAGTDSGDLNADFAAVVETAKNEWMTEANGNIDKIPLIIHTDQHSDTNKPLFDFISKIVDWYDVGKVINLGDTVNSYGGDLLVDSGLKEYVESMANVPYSKRIEIFGNHDTWGENSDGTGRFTPQNYLHKYFRNIYARRLDNHGNFVTYDDNYNVKYVVVSGFAYDADKGGYSYYILSSTTIDKIIAELEKADGYDVILLSHVPLSGVTRSNLNAIWEARKTKTSGSVSDTYGVSHAFDFTSCDGELLCGLHGHNHVDGHAYVGELLDVWFDAFYQSPQCFYFVIVDRENSQLNIWKVDNTPQYQNFQIPFDKPTE